MLVLLQLVLGPPLVLFVLFALCDAAASLLTQSPAGQGRRASALRGRRIRHPDPTDLCRSSYYLRTSIYKELALGVRLRGGGGQQRKSRHSRGVGAGFKRREPSNQVRGPRKSVCFTVSAPVPTHPDSGQEGRQAVQTRGRGVTSHIVTKRQRAEIDSTQ